MQGYDGSKGDKGEKGSMGLVFEGGRGDKGEKGEPGLPGSECNGTKRATINCTEITVRKGEPGDKGDKVCKAIVYCTNFFPCLIYCIFLSSRREIYVYNFHFYITSGDG